MTETEQTHEHNGHDQTNADIFLIQQQQIERLRAELRERDEAEQKEPVSLEEILERFTPDPEYKPVYKLRELKGRDSKMIMGMIRQIRDDERILSAVNGQAGDAAVSQILDALLEKLEDEITPWLADVAQIEDPEEAEFFWEFDVGNDLMNDEAFLKRLRSGARFVMAGRKLFGR